jgi:tetratricopeptide (TPR) repeat protein
MRARLVWGDTKGADAALQECFRRSPQSAPLGLVMGRFCLVTQRHSQAEAQFRRAIQFDPQYGKAFEELAQNGRPAPLCFCGVPLLYGGAGKRALCAWLDLGMLLFHGGRRQEAQPVFRQLAGLTDKTYRPVYALYLLETGQRDAAIAELERLAKENPADRAARARLVKMYMIAGRRSDAQRLLAQAIVKNPKDADALLQRSEMSIEAGKFQDAQNDLNSAGRATGTRGSPPT